MKKRKNNPRAAKRDRDTMRPEYDFSTAVRGVTAQRYARGANIAVIDPELLDVFPNSLTVNRALHRLAPRLRRELHSRAKRKTA